ncbi:MAG: AI-2E family transporter [Bacteriovorax sp.]|nr:AI-2E family transporter [Bacteriovorax sp.]
MNHYKTEENERTKITKIEIPFRTYVNLFFALIIALFIFQLSYHFLLLFISINIAMTLSSAKKFLIKKGWREKIALTTILILYISLMLFIVIFIIPHVVSQMMDIFNLSSQIKKQLFIFPFATSIETHMKDFINSSPDIMTSLRSYLAAIGKQTLGGVFDFGLLFIASIFMFIDGSRSYRWLRSHFSENIKTKLDITVQEINPIMTAYVFGQAIVSSLAAIVVYTSASVLHIPGAITLAALAAILDILPVIGFITIAFISAMLGFAVSIKAAVTILIIHILYHLFESYVLTPYIYGSRMKLSPLVVLLSLLLGASMAGIPGMIAILPIVAAYSPIERLWIRGRIFNTKKKK